MITQATGILSEDGALRFHRRFGAPLDEVWAWITDPDQSAKWIGRWTGDPSTGSLHLHVDTEAARGTQDLVIETCAPPRELVVRLETWQVGLTLSHGNSVTTVELAQGIDDADDAEQVGPVWDYYLDRLTAATSTGTWKACRSTTTGGWHATTGRCTSVRSRSANPPRCPGHKPPAPRARRRRR